MTLTVALLLERKSESLALSVIVGEVGLERKILAPEVSSPGLALADTLDLVGPHLDFIGLGTNDLTQYSLASCEKFVAIWRTLRICLKRKLDFAVTWKRLLCLKRQHFRRSLIRLPLGPSGSSILGPRTKGLINSLQNP